MLDRLRMTVHVSGMSVQTSIVIGAIIIAGAIAFVKRWDVAAFGGDAFRLDRWTGEVATCSGPDQKRADARALGVGLVLRCQELTAQEVLAGHVMQ